MAKIGIMGGTFNPIHNGHIEIARAAYEQFDLDEVWFMPNNSPAYKSDNGIVSGEHRLAMVELAISEYPYFRTSDFELQRQGKTYSYVTFTMLDEQFADHKFFFIMGADSLFYFDKWVHPEIILEHTHILIASRDDKDIGQIEERITYLENIYGKDKFDTIQCEIVDCSSSEIRKCFSIHNEQSSEYVKRYINPSVYDYIIDNNLY